MNAPGIAPPRETRGIDHVLLTVILLLTVIGVVSVYSAGSERSMALYHSPHAMFLNQLSRAAVGFGLMLLVSTIPYRFWRRMAWPAFGVAVILLMLLFVDGVAETSKGATRWLRLGPIRFQPSEVARYAAILFVAAWAHTKGALMEQFKDGIGIPLAVTGLLAAMIVLQPDFSTGALLMITVLVLLFIAGTKLSHLIMTVSPIAVIGFLVVWLSDYKRARVMTFLAPYKDPDNAGYQILQSWIGLGRGGVFGVGLGESRQKLFFLPDAHTDFIYSIIGEEMGLIGTILLLGMFIVLILRGFRVATRCPDPFGSYLAAGITFSVGSYALANMAIAVGVFPATGLPLPLISYGGTSLIMTLVAMGIVLNISRYQSAKPQRLPLNGRYR